MKNTEEIAYSIAVKWGYADGVQDIRAALDAERSEVETLKTLIASGRSAHNEERVAGDYLARELTALCAKVREILNPSTAIQEEVRECRIFYPDSMDVDDLLKAKLEVFLSSAVTLLKELEAK